MNIIGKRVLNMSRKNLNEVIGIVTTILLLVAFVLYFVVLFNILDVDVGLLNASIVMVLLFVTYLYTDHTAQIVEETRKDRKFGLIQKRLEKLYYPLEDILNSIEIRHQGGVNIIVINYDPKKVKKWYSINDIIPFSYLASTELKTPLKSFIEILRKEKHIESDDFHQLIEKIEGIMYEDIERFRKELDDSVM